MTDPMTDRQRGAIFKWAADLKLDKDELNELAEYITGKRIAALTVDDARRVLDALAGAAAYLVLRFHLRPRRR